MVENVSKRLDDLENIVACLSTKVNNSVGTPSSSPEEKKRIPPQLSVSLFTCCSANTQYVVNVLYTENCCKDT